MKKQLLLVVMAICLWSCNQPKPEPVEPVAVTPKPIDFADPKASEVCKAGLSNLSSGDIDAFSSIYSDNAVYRFNNGDSIAGKEAITAYWKDRRGKVIDKIEFSNDIWLPLNVNESKQVRTGLWVLGWYKTTATYKTGKSMSQWIHTLYHFTPDGKIDEVIQYLDRAPINAATAK